MNHPSYTPDQLSEQYGSVMGHAALDAMLAAKTQAKRCQILKDALNDLCQGGPTQATAGFAVALVNVIERGLEAITNG